MTSKRVAAAADIFAAFQRAGFRLHRARVNDDHVVVYLHAEDWELLRKTLLKGAGVLADERRAEDYANEYYGGWGES